MRANTYRFFFVGLLFSFLWSSSSYAALIESIASGPWQSPATWAGGVVPGPADDVIINAAHNVSLAGAASCLSLQIRPGGTLNTATFDFSVTGSTDVEGAYQEVAASGNKLFGGLLRVRDGAFFQSSGIASFTFEAGIANETTLDFSFNIASSGDIVFDLTPQLVRSTSLMRLGNSANGLLQFLTDVTLESTTSTARIVIQKSSINVGAAGAPSQITNNANVWIADGTLNAGDPASLWLNGDNSVLEISGTSSIPMTGGGFLATGDGNTVIYSAPSLGNIASGSYVNLVINDGAKALDGGITVSGNLEIGPTQPVSFSSNSFNISIAGNWTIGSGSIFDPVSADVVFNGANLQLISGDVSFNNLVIQKLSGGDVRLNGGDITVFNSLTFFSGRLLLGDHNLNYNTALPIAYTASGYVVTNGSGKLRWNQDIASGNFEFPVGDFSAVRVLELESINNTEVRFELAPSGVYAIPTALHATNGLNGLWEISGPALNTLMRFKNPGGNTNASSVIRRFGTSWGIVFATNPVGSNFESDGTVPANGFFAILDANDPPIVRPVISSIAPVSALPNTNITITGSGFNSGGPNDVYFGPVKTTGTSNIDGTSITVTVPEGASSLAALVVRNPATGLQANSITSSTPFFRLRTTAVLPINEENYAYTTYTPASSLLAQTLAVADLDNDSYPDFAMGEGGGADVWMNNAGTGFDAPVANPSLTGYLVSADFNGDGILDVAAATGATLLVSLGAGDGTLFNSLSFPTGLIGTYGITTGDFNNDGYTDVVLHGNAVHVLLNNGDGTFGTPLTTGIIFGGGSTSGGPSPVAVVDFNNDGNLDIIAADRALFQNQVVIVTGNGDGTFNSSIAYTTPDTPGSVVIADFNNDGNQDYAVSYTGGISVNLGDGAVSFSNLGLPIPASAAPFALKAADLNGDGIVDLIGAFNNSVYAFTGVGTGSFNPLIAIELSQSFIEIRAIEVADFNRDGKPDLLTANAWTGEAGIALYSMPAPVPRISSIVPDKAEIGESITLQGQNFNQGGPNEVWIGGLKVIANANATGTAITLTVPLGVGSYGPIEVRNPVTGLQGSSLSGSTPFFSLLTPSVLTINENSYDIQAPIATGDGPSHISRADLNGDGNLDLVVSNLNERTVSILHGDGTGTFTVVASFNPGSFASPSQPSASVIADFNGDGLPDFAVASGNFLNNDEVSIFLNTGNGITFSPVFLPSGGNIVADLQAGDFNGDGLPDIAVVNFGTFAGSNNINILLNEGDGTSFTSQIIPAGGLRNPAHIVLGDFDKDNDLDIIVQIGDIAEYLLNNGSGNFSLETFATPISGLGNARGMSIGDFNGDGNIDFAVSTYSNGVSVLYGDGNFEFLQSNITTSFGINGMYTANMDGDFYTDLLFAGSLPNTTGILLGNGSTFSNIEIPMSVDASIPYYALDGDFNKDGKPDFVTALYSTGAIQVGLYALPAPILTSAINVGNTGFVAQWQGNYLSYEIELATDNTFVNLVRSVNVIEAENYTFDRLTPNTVYFYRVRGNDGSDFSPYSNIKMVYLGPVPGSARAVNLAGGGYARTPSTFNSDFGNFGSFSITAWIKVDHGLNRTIAQSSQLTTDAGENYYWRFYVSGGELHLDQSDGFDNSTSAAFRQVPENEWAHVAVTKDDLTGTIRFYVNGLFAGSDTPPISTVANNGPLFVGATRGVAGTPSDDPDDTASDLFLGEIDELTFWGIALLEAGIKGNMTRKWKGEEEDMLAYFRFDENTGIYSEDRASGSTVDLIWTGSYERVVSGAALGDASISDYASAPSSALSAPLSLGDLHIDATTATGVHIYTVADLPNSEDVAAPITDLILTNSVVYYGVFLVQADGALDAPTADVRYEKASVGSTDRLASRAVNASVWSEVAGQVFTPTTITASEQASGEFVEALALDVFYSRKSGLWSDDTAGDGTWSIDSPTGSSCDCVPTSGARVIIDAAHAVAADVSIDPLRIALEGTLSLGNLTHNLSNTLVVDEGPDAGVLRIEGAASANSIALTGGAFFVQPQNIVLFEGTAGYQIPARAYPTLKADAIGVVALPLIAPTEFTVYGDLLVGTASSIFNANEHKLILPDNTTHRIEAVPGATIVLNDIGVEGNTELFEGGAYFLRGFVAINPGVTFTNSASFTYLEDPATVAGSGVLRNNGALYYRSSQPLFLPSSGIDFASLPNTVVYEAGTASPAAATYRNLVFRDSRTTEFGSVIIADNISFDDTGINASLTLSEGTSIIVNNDLVMNNTALVQIDFGSEDATLVVAGDLLGSTTSSIVHNASSTANQVLELRGAINSIGVFGNTSLGRSVVRYAGADQQVFGANYGTLAIQGGGTKTLSAAVSVNDSLILDEGVLMLDNFNLTWASNNAGLTSGNAFSYVESNASGILIMTNASLSSSDQMLLPIGANGVYAPVTASGFGSIPALSGRVGQPGSNGLASIAAPNRVDLVWELSSDADLYQLEWNPSAELGTVGATTTVYRFNAFFEPQPLSTFVPGIPLAIVEGQAPTAATQFAVLDVNPFMVYNTNDAGPGSLRQAILNANTDVNANEIIFNIPNTDPGYDPITETWTIQPLLQLPTLVGNGDVLNAYTQPGSQPNTLLFGNDAVLKIVLKGDLAPVGTHALVLSGGQLVRGFSIVGFSGGSGIYMQSSGANQIQGNWIGVYPDATAEGNGNGIFILTPNNTIGDVSPADRNVISANSGSGIEIQFVGGHSIINNYIGVSPSGGSNLGNGARGILLQSVDNTEVINNLVSGNASAGVEIEAASNLSINNNRIGVDHTGNNAIPNLQGVLVQNSDNITLSGNQLSGNSGAGLFISNSSQIDVRANNIGERAGSATALPNADGIYIANSNLVNIGTNDPANANTIAHNSNNGIWIVGTTDNFQHRIRINRIYCNTSSGILVGASANGGVAVPEILSAFSTLIEGTSDDAAIIDLYSNNGINCTNPEQGRVYIGTVVANASGDWSFSGTFTPGHLITAVQTDVNGNSSEFSVPVEVLSSVAVEPPLQPLQLFFTSRSENTIRGIFTRPPLPYPSGYLVTVRRAEVPSAVPADDIFYNIGDQLAPGVSVIGNSADTTFAAFGFLQPATRYVFDVFAFNSAGLSINYKQNNPLSGLATTLAVEPRFVASGLVIDSLSSNFIAGSFTANFAQASNYLVIIRNVFTPSVPPLDGRLYLPGSQTGQGNTVLRMLNGSSFIAEGLQANTEYVIDVYSYNGVGESANYLTAPFLSGRVRTLVEEPENQAVGLLFTEVSFSTLNGSFTAAQPVADGYVVLRRLAGAPAIAPRDGVAYQLRQVLRPALPADTTHVSVVVAIGPATNFSDLELIPDTTYVYDVYAYNTSGPGRNNYKQNLPLSGQVRTLPFIPRPLSLVPDSEVAESPEMTLVVNGQHFAETAEVLWQERPLETTLAGAGQLRAIVPAELLRRPGNYGIRVNNPVTGGRISEDSLIFRVLPGVEVNQAGPTPALMSPGRERHVVYRLQLRALGEAALLNSLRLQPAGTYQPNDFRDATFQLWLSNDPFLDASDASLGNFQAVPSGQALQFNGLALGLPQGSTRFLILSVNVAENAIQGHTLFFGANNPAEALAFAEPRALRGQDVLPASGIQTVRNINLDDPAEYEALIRLYNATNGNNWTIRWDLNAPPGTWRGVDIENGRVVSINLQDNNLTGDVSEVFGSNQTPFPFLKYLNLSNNQLTGGIPEWITNLHTLEYLDLSKNRLSGPIPARIAALRNLVTLWLSFNEFTMIDPAIGELSQLRFLFIDNNGIAQLPESIGNLSRVETFIFRNNRISVIPSSVGQMLSLVYLDFAFNEVEELPESLLQLRNLQQLLFHNNQISRLPLLARIESLRELLIYSNLLQFGEIEKLLPFSGGRTESELTVFYSPQARVGSSRTIDVSQNQPFILSIAVSGSQNRYQWFRNGVAIPGANSVNYQISAAQAIHTGIYTVHITSPLAPLLTLESHDFEVNINCGGGEAISLSVTTQGNTEYCEGENISTLLVANTGTAVAPEVQWLLNGVPLAGAVSERFTATAPGVYSLRLRVAGGCVFESERVEIKRSNRPQVTLRSEGGQLVADVSASNLSFSWFLDEVLLAEFSGQSRISPVVSGQYRVQVSSAAGCASLSAPVNFTITSLNPEEQAEGWALYPNPSERYFRLVIPQTQAGSLHYILSDGKGRVLQQKTLQGDSELLIDTDGLSSGTYLLQIKGATLNKVFKLMKQN